MSNLNSLLDHFFSHDPLADMLIERKARMVLLDTLGCVMAGLQAPEVEHLERRHTAIDAGVFRFPNSARRMAPSAAGHLFAVAACWDEACEGLARARGSAGVPVLAACLPIAWVSGKSLGALLRALVVGYEVGGRLGEALRIRPGMQVDATWPSFAAAAAVSHLLGLSAEQAHTAIQLAASQMPISLYSPIKEGANGLKTYLAHAASLALTSALAAEAGMTAPKMAMEEIRQLALGATDAFPELAPLEDSFTVEAYIKRWAGARHLHYGAEAALALREKLGGNSAAVTGIRLASYDEAITYCGNRAPKTQIQAQFSLAWGVAAALATGGLEPQVFHAERLRDHEMRRLEHLVKISADPDRNASGRRGATLTVKTAEGELTETVDIVEGDPRRPMSEEAVRDKFMRYAGAAADETIAAALARQVLESKLDLPVSRLW
jgi:2-methylcitrate dehydratase PrpD